MILSILFGIGLYKFIYGKYLDGYYDDDIKSKLSLYTIVCSFVFFISMNIDAGNYSEHIAIHIMPELVDNIVLLNLMSFFFRLIISTVFEVLFTGISWIVFKLKFLT